MNRLESTWTMVLLYDEIALYILWFLSLQAKLMKERQAILITMDWKDFCRLYFAKQNSVPLPLLLLHICRMCCQILLETKQVKSKCPMCLYIHTNTYVCICLFRFVIFHSSQPLEIVVQERRRRKGRKIRYNKIFYLLEINPKNKISVAQTNWIYHTIQRRCIMNPTQTIFLSIITPFCRTSLQ